MFHSQKQKHNPCVWTLQVHFGLEPKCTFSTCWCPKQEFITEPAKPKMNPKNNGISATKKRFIWSLTWYWTTSQNWHTFIGSCFWISVSHRYLGMNLAAMPDPIYRVQFDSSHFVPAIPRYYKCEGEGILEDRGHQPRMKPSENLKTWYTLPVFWTNGRLKMDHSKGKWILSHLSQPSMFRKYVCCQEKKKCLLFWCGWWCSHRSTWSVCAKSLPLPGS